MDLQSMRSLGVTQVDAFSSCGYHASVDVSALPDHEAVANIRARLRCSKCGARPMNTRPHWTQYRP
jgi:hypothetical protein